MTLSIVILAAGHGKRMCSDLPKVLCPLAGKSMLQHVIETVQPLSTELPIVIVGHQADIVQRTMQNFKITWCKQAEQLGTGHAVLQALPLIPETHHVLILYGDVPLVTSETLKRLIQNTPRDGIGMITALIPEPTHFGRIIRDTTNKIMGIIEERDANTEQKAIKEINSGIYLIPAVYLKKILPQLNNHNAQKEFYLTDVISSAVKEGIAIYSHAPVHCNEEIIGVNDLVQLAQVERFYQMNYAKKLMLTGVTFYDPARFDMRGELDIGRNCIIDINVILEGAVKIGNNCKIGSNTILRNTILEDGIEIKSHCVIEGAMIRSHAVIGPYARIRPTTIIESYAEIGNFIEIKNSKIDEYTKVHHVGYLGDSELGKRVNIGAGAITCNYDGANKHKTIIKDDAFIGSNTELIAPVIIGEQATIGAGSTITHDAPAHQLTLSRTKQTSISHWKRPNKKKL